MADGGRIESSDPSLWMRRARDELVGADRNASDLGVVPRIACTLAQQSSEKALKALLLANGVRPPRTHSLEVLTGLFPDQLRARFAGLTGVLEDLTVWAIEGRYPEDEEEATRDDAVRAVAQAGQIVALVQGILEEGARQEVGFDVARTLTAPTPTESQRMLWGAPQAGSAPSR